jgi:hypothetical protein
MSGMKFEREWCEQCESFFIRCPKCGNNCCNGGHGEVDGQPCDVCALAYQYQDLQEENARLREGGVNGWIPVHDRLPDEDCVVWGFGKTQSGYQFLGEAFLSGSSSEWYENTMLGHRVMITHWQEMVSPNPPESETP